MIAEWKHDGVQFEMEVDMAVQNPGAGVVGDEPNGSVVAEKIWEHERRHESETHLVEVPVLTTSRTTWKYFEKEFNKI
jgi:hypothetical protein